MVSVKLADAISGLAGASASCTQEANIEIKNNVKQEDFYCLGSVSPSNAIYGIFEATASITRVKADDANFDKFDEGTKQAMLLSVIDASTTIGASTNPSLSFTFAPATVSEYSEGTGFDDVMTETFTLTGMYSQSDSKMMSATLVNDEASY
jgi:hypothetical protein